MLIGPCIAIVRANTRIAQSKVSINRVFSVIDEKIDIKVDNNGYRIDNSEIKKIDFKNVSFRYGEDLNLVLNDINLQFEKGSNRNCWWKWMWQINNNKSNIPTLGYK